MLTVGEGVLHLHLFKSPPKMKKLLLVGTVAIALLAASCKSKSERLVGNWTVTECTITNLDELRKKELMDTPDSLMEQAKAMLEDNIKKFTENSKKETYEFEADSFNINRAGRKYNGVWKVSSDNKMLFLVPNMNANSPIDAFTIESLEAKEIKISRALTPENSAIYTLEKQ